MSVFLRRILLSVLLAGAMLAFSPSATKAQSAKNITYVELAGNSLLYSLNYERVITPKITGRVGLMQAGVGGVSFMIAPIMGNYLVGSGNHRLELGVGPQIFNVSIDTKGEDFGGFDESGTVVGGTATIGYRYQPTDGGFLFRIGVSPTFSSAGFLPWAGLSFGYAF